MMTSEPRKYRAPVEVGPLLRQLRFEAGLTQEALAERTGLGVRSIQAIELGEHQPRRDTIRRLNDALELTGAARAQFEAAARPVPRQRVAPSPLGQLRARPTELKTGRVRRHNLPAPLTSFVGREIELVTVPDLLRTTRLLTLTGAGGVGKTRLALEAARSLLERYPDGVWLADLGPLADPALVPLAIAAAHDLRERPDEPITATLLTFLGGKQLLLILDNCEHLVEACGRLTREILEACPTVSVLATSRQPLRLTGETAFRVPSLAIPSAETTPTSEDILGFGAVRLFVERANAARPGLGLTIENAPLVGQICRRLDGIPLALELAGARVSALTIEQIASRLEDQFRLLAVGDLTALPRHQTLRGTMDWSYALLDEAERRLWRRLAVFAGGFTLEAAEAVGGEASDGRGVNGTDVLDLVARLVDKSLIVMEERRGEARYRLLEPLRQYAWEKLVEIGGAAATASSHASYFLTRVAGTKPLEVRRAALVPPLWLERERHNLRAALRWFRDEGEATEGLRLACKLQDLWYGYGPRSEDRVWITTFLQLTIAEPRTLVRAAALHSLGWSATGQGNPAGACADFEEGLAIARECGDRSAEAMFLHGLGCMELELGNLAGARQLVEASVLQRELSDRVALTDTLIWCGNLAFAEGDHARAQSLYEEGLALGEDRDWCWRLLGYVAIRAGDVSGARAHIRDSLQLYLQKSLISGQVECLTAFAGIAVARERWITAGRLLGAAERQQLVIGGRLSMPDRTEHERFLVATRAALGEEAYAVARAEGQAMTLEQAIAYALEEDGRSN